jgi:hypothetical protein
VFFFFQLSKTQGVERSNGPGTHGKNIAVNAAHTGSSTLERFNSRGVVVRFNLEHHAIAIANVHQAGIFFTGFTSMRPPSRGRVFSHLMEFL